MGRLSWEPTDDRVDLGNRHEETLMSKNRTMIYALAGGTALAATLTAVSANAQPQAPRQASLQAAVDSLVADGQPGVIVMTRRGDRVSHVTAGVADRATGTPMDARLQVRIASVTKSFTATVLLQLVAEHRVSLDDSVDKWLPGLVHGNGNDGSKITLRQLLQHTSGLGDYVQDPRLYADPRRQWKPAELVGIAMEKPPLSAPGKEWHYTDTNYVLAGMVIEKVTHHSAAAEIGRRIIRPLRLSNTSFPLRSRNFPGPYVHGYWDDHGDVSTMISPSMAWTSGAIISTVDDVARFHRALFTGRLLPAAEQRMLTSTLPVTDDGQKEDYGLGVYRVRLSCGYAWGHDGGFPGYRTWTYTSADGKRQAVITYNQSSATLEHQPNFHADLTHTAALAFCG
jgi:D-alanyl-D-alanine carboxypeptidase